MKILALDTATEACSVALLCDGDTHQRQELAPRRHAQLILPMVDAVLAAAGIRLNQLDAIAFGRGPGAFTGVRIAAGVAQGLALGAGLPVIPVSSLATLAQAEPGAAAAATGSTPWQPATGPAQSKPGNGAIVLAAIDARMSEIYWGAYARTEDGLAKPVCTEQVASPETVRVPRNAQVFGVGSGWGAYGEQLQRVLGEQVSGFDAQCFPLAQDMLPLARREYQAGRCLSAEQALPVYLRNNVAKRS